MASLYILYTHTVSGDYAYVQTLQSRKGTNTNTLPILYADRTVQGCCNGKVIQVMAQYACAADRDSRCVVERKLVYYCMIERGRAEEIAIER